MQSGPIRFQFSKYFKIVFVGAMLAILVGVAVYQIGAPAQSLSRQNDGFFYAAEARAAAQGTEIAPPVFSTFRSKPTNLYIGYTSLLRLFVPHTDDWHALLENMRLVEVALACVLGFVIFVSAYSISGSMLASLLAFIVAFSPSLLFRITLDRPDCLVAIIFVLFLWAIIKRNYYATAVLAFCLPLTYSISFVLLIPAVVFVAAESIHSGRDGLRNAAPFFLTALLATIVGIFVHPQSLNYLYNGTVLNIVVLAGGGILKEASELDPIRFGIQQAPWILTLVGIIAAYLVYIKRKSIQIVSPDSMFLCLLSVLFAIMYIHTARFSTYFFPILGLLVAVACRDSEHLRPKLLSAIKCIAVLFFAGVLYVGIAQVYDVMSAYMPTDLYKNSADYLAQHPGMVLVRFDQYAPIIFFNPTALLSSGRANIFMQGYSTEITHMYILIGSGQVPFSVGLHALGATYFLDDGQNHILTAALSKDDCLSVRYTDPTYPQMKLYALKNCSELGTQNDKVVRQ